MSTLDHIGLTVGDLDRSIQFYSTVLDCVVRERAVIKGAEVETLTGVAGAVIHTADLNLSCGGMLELLQYLGPNPTVLAQRRFDAGHSHIAFTVNDVDVTGDLHSAVGQKLGQLHIRKRVAAILGGDELAHQRSYSGRRAGAAARGRELARKEALE